MKKYTLFCLAAFPAFIVLAGLLCACKQDTPSLPQAHSVTPVDSILNMRDFSYEQYQIWDSATRPWRLDEFDAHCLGRTGIRQNCLDCGEMLVEVVLRIDVKGNITQITECGSEMFCHSGRPQKELDAVKTCMIESFSKVKLPAPFRGIQLRVKIGESTKC